MGAAASGWRSRSSVLVVFVDGAPFWGSDVGGILSLVPAFGLTAVLMLGLRVRLKTVVWGVVGLVVALAAFGARPQPFS